MSLLLLLVGSSAPGPDTEGGHRMGPVRRRRQEPRLEPEWTIEQDDAELLEILGVVLGADP